MWHPSHSVDPAELESRTSAFSSHISTSSEWRGSEADNCRWSRPACKALTNAGKRQKRRPHGGYPGAPTGRGRRLPRTPGFRYVLTAFSRARAAHARRKLSGARARSKVLAPKAGRPKDLRTIFAPSVTFGTYGLPRSAVPRRCLPQCSPRFCRGRCP